MDIHRNFVPHSEEINASSEFSIEEDEKRLRIVLDFDLKAEGFNYIKVTTPDFKFTGVLNRIVNWKPEYTANISPLKAYSVYFDIHAWEGDLSHNDLATIRFF